MSWIGRTHPENTCPACHRKMDAATSTSGDHGPKTGDYSICIYCGAVLVFGEELRLRLPTTAEASEIQEDPMAVRALGRVQALIRARNGSPRN